MTNDQKQLPIECVVHDHASKVAKVGQTGVIPFMKCLFSHAPLPLEEAVMFFRICLCKVLKQCQHMCKHAHLSRMIWSCWDMSRPA